MCRAPDHTSRRTTAVSSRTHGRRRVYNRSRRYSRTHHTCFQHTSLLSSQPLCSSSNSKDYTTPRAIAHYLHRCVHPHRNSTLYCRYNRRCFPQLYFRRRYPNTGPAARCTALGWSPGRRAPIAHGSRRAICGKGLLCGPTAAPTRSVDPCAGPGRGVAAERTRARAAPSSVGHYA